MNNKIYLKDIAGYSEEKEEAQKLINILKKYKEYQKIGAYIPKGLILSGNPGVGKTMLAKAIANESEVPFYEFESNESETEAETIKSIKDLFSKAKENAPSIIFIDELDELVMTTDFRSDYSRKTTKILLTEIDGISSSSGVLVIATTNARPMLPPALIRSGRMDKRITMEMPDAIDREAIFKLYLNKNKRFKDIDAHDLALKTTDFSGADIKTLINETIIDCESRNIADYHTSDFDRNIPVVRFKDIKKSSRNGPSDMTCYHEIGHFVTEYKLTGNIGSISTERFGTIKGHVFFEEVDIETDLITRDTLKDKLITILGGMAGEEMMCGDIGNGSLSDVGKARNCIMSLANTGAFGFEKLGNVISYGSLGRDVIPVSENRVKAINDLESSLLAEAYDKAKNIIKDNKKLVDVLYAELKQRERLSKREIEIIIRNMEKEGVNYETQN